MTTPSPLIATLDATFGGKDEWAIIPVTFAHMRDLRDRLKRAAQAEKRACSVCHMSGPQDASGKPVACQWTDCPYQATPSPDTLTARAKAAYEKRHACHGVAAVWERLDQRDQAAEREAIRAADAVGQPGPNIADLKPGMAIEREESGFYLRVVLKSVRAEEHHCDKILGATIQSWPAPKAEGRGM